MSELLVVVGATGGQGGSVVQEVLKKGHYQKIRGITRNVSSTNARSIASLGVEMVEADMNDEESLVRAFEGASAIFAVTDFYETFRKADPWTAMDVEYRHGVNLAKAAARTASLKHYVWSTLPSSHQVTNKKIFVPHFEAKARVDDFIKSSPGLLEKTTFLWLGFFMVNFLRPTFAPMYAKALGKHVLMLPTPPSTRFAMLGDHVANVGKFVRAILSQPSQSLPGKYVLGAVETVSIGDFVMHWGATVGKKIEYVQVTAEGYSRLFPGYGAEMQTMFQFWYEYGDCAWPEKDLVTASELGIKDELVSLEQSCKSMDWGWVD